LIQDGREGGTKVQVYLLWHVHRSDDETDEKLIGVYSTEAMARDAGIRLAIQPGFVDLPELLTDDGAGQGGFFISPYAIDEDHWSEGYVVVTDADIG
jgi:hypothetical protein